MSRLATLKRRALELYESEGWLLGDRAGLDPRFDNALDLLWMAFQPIVGWIDRSIYGHEALVRSAEPTLTNPGLLFETAERLGRAQDLSRQIRSRVALHLFGKPSPRFRNNGSIFAPRADEPPCGSGGT